MTLGDKGIVVPGIALLFHLISRPGHDLTYAIDQALILAFHLVPFEIWNTLWTVMVTKRWGVSTCLDCRLSLLKVVIVPCFVLKVEELFSFFDIHEINLNQSDSQIVFLFITILIPRLEIVKKNIWLRFYNNGEQFKKFRRIVHSKETDPGFSTSLYCRYFIFDPDKQTGPYWTIQQAIDAALPNSLIKIT